MGECRYRWVHPKGCRYSITAALHASGPGNAVRISGGATHWRHTASPLPRPSGRMLCCMPSAAAACEAPMDCNSTEQAGRKQAIITGAGKSLFLAP